MKYIILVILSLLLAAIAFAATGDKPNQSVLQFRNVSSATKPATCVLGEIKYNRVNIFLCYSTNKWTKVPVTNF